MLLCESDEIVVCDAEACEHQPRAGEVVAMVVQNVRARQALDERRVPVVAPRTQ